MHHYIIQVSSKPMPAFKAVIQQLRTQQNSVTYLALVLANHCLLHYDIKHKNKNEQLWLHLSSQDGSSPQVPLLHDRSGNREHLVAQLGNPVKAEHLMHFGGSFVQFGDVAFQVRGLRSVYTKLWDTATKITRGARNTRQEHETRQNIKIKDQKT